MRLTVFDLGVGVDSSWLIAAASDGHPALAGLRNSLAAVVHSNLGTEEQVIEDFRDGYLLPYLDERGVGVEVLTPRVTDRHSQVQHNFYDYLWQQAIVPSRAARSCTDRWKIAAARAWVEEHLGDQPVDYIIGFDCGETGRATKLAEWANEKQSYLFPMIEMGVDRLHAAAGLMTAGLPVPRRSACYCCPFSLSQDWAEMAVRWPGHYEQCASLEEHVQAERGRAYLFARRPLREHPQPRRFKVSDEARRLFSLAERLLGQISPAWPSYALCRAAEQLYGEVWPKALRKMQDRGAPLRMGPAVLDDPWQIYVRLEWCINGEIAPLPVATTLPCGAWQMAEDVSLPSAGALGRVL